MHKLVGVKAAHQEIADILQRDGVIRRSEHPGLDTAIAWLVRSGRLTAVLRGVYAPAARAADPRVRIAAVLATAPDAVLLGSAAAMLTYLPDQPVEVIEASLPYRRSSPAGFSFTRERVSPACIMQLGQLRLTTPAATALRLSRSIGGAAIDDVLRTRAATLAQLYAALAQLPHRRGNRDLRALLLDSRDEPWSAAERKFHRILRLLGYRGWKANYPVELFGQTYFLDVAFVSRRVVIEIDGRLAHSARHVFESDRHRQNALVRAGWTVIRLTWAMLDDLDLVSETLHSVVGNPRTASLNA